MPTLISMLPKVNPVHCDHLLEETQLMQAATKNLFLIWRRVLRGRRHDFILRWFGNVFFCAWSRSTEEELPAVGKSHIHADAFMLESFRLVALDDELCSNRDGVFRDAMADQ